MSKRAASPCSSRCLPARTISISPSNMRRSLRKSATMKAAVSTLERMLIYAPNTPRLQLELGMLYYKLGSYEVARSYFAQALANPSVPPSVAAQVRLYLSAARPRRRSAGLLRLDLLGDPLGEQRQCRTRHAKRDAERHRLHPRSAIGRPRRLERAQYRHHALRLGPEAPGRPHRVRRALLRHRLFRSRSLNDIDLDFVEADARSELQHEAVEPRQDPHLSLRHRRSSPISATISTLTKRRIRCSPISPCTATSCGGDSATNAYHIGFGDPATPANKSAYIDDVHYAAIETPGATSVLRNNGQPYAQANSTAYLASGSSLA